MAATAKSRSAHGFGEYIDLSGPHSADRYQKGSCWTTSAVFDTAPTLCIWNPPHRGRTFDVPLRNDQPASGVIPGMGGTIADTAGASPVIVNQPDATG